MTEFILEENPELSLEQLRAKYRELSEKVKQRKRLKMNGGGANGNQNLSGGVGCGEQLNAAQKERMQLLTTAAFDRYEDWQLYELMSKDDEDDGQDEDEAELILVKNLDSSPELQQGGRRRVVATYKTAGWRENRKRGKSEKKKKKKKQRQPRRENRVQRSSGIGIGKKMENRQTATEKKEKTEK
ncbi:hypothetical protein ACLOJK_037697 [Asimina triloba]